LSIKFVCETVLVMGDDVMTHSTSIDLRKGKVLA
jgi:hypothetical protein